MLNNGLKFGDIPAPPDYYIHIRKYGPGQNPEDKYFIGRLNFNNHDNSIKIKPNAQEEIISFKKGDDNIEVSIMSNELNYWNYKPNEGLDTVGKTPEYDLGIT